MARHQGDSFIDRGRNQVGSVMKPILFPSRSRSSKNSTAASTLAR